MGLSFFLSIFFFSVTLSGLAWLRSAHNEKQHEQLTTSLGGGRICAYRVIFSYIPSLVHSSLFIFLSFWSVPRDRELPLSCRTYRRHLPFVPRFILRNRGRPLSLLYVLFYVEDGGCMCMCVCLHPCRWILFADLLFFFPLFGKGLHRVSRYTSRTSCPLENSTFLWLLYPTILSLLHPALHRSRSFVGRIPSTFLPPLDRSSCFNFVHFCFPKLLLRIFNSIETFIGFYFLVYFSVNQIKLTVLTFFAFV